MTRRFAALALLTVLAICLFQVSAQAQGCAMCRTALENSPEGKGMAASFNNGIVFLLGVPYVIFGAFGVAVYRAHKKKKASERPANPYIPHNKD